MSDGPRYLFAPLEQRGVVAGLRSGQLGVIGTTLVIAVALLRAAPGTAGVGAGAALVLVGLTFAFVPVGGRPMEQWAPLAARHAVCLVSGRNRTTPGARRRARDPVLPAPLALRHVTFTDVDIGGGRGQMVIINDRSRAVASAVLGVRGRSFALLDPDEQHRRLTAWAGVLASLAREGGPVKTIQWVERNVGGDSEALQRHLDGAGVLDDAAPPTKSYRALIAEAGPLTQDHECYVVLTVKHSRAHRSADVLARELRLLEGQLRAADIEVEGALDTRALGSILRSAHDPGVRPQLARCRSMHPDRRGPRVDASWPAFTETTWHSFRADGWWHATWWISEWPRSEVGPEFLAPLLLHGDHRTVALVMGPISPSDGFREAEAARTAAAADEELRRRAGFMTTARRSREAEGVMQRERELSDGHASYRFAGYVTVSAPSPEALEDACGKLVQQAHQSRLDVRRLCGAQDLAFTWTLPLGRGLGQGR